ncbi:MAG: prolipoprotein diacylglyceryl transferase [Bacteroidales bacterium]|nr:prolipoprotein diacylglyceryl transferase [Candidatus Colicola faecequi]
MELLSVVWDFNPIAFTLGPLSVRWYGLMWALGIYLCWMVVDQLYKHDHCPEDWIDKVFTYMVIGVIVGARLGHCFFYEWHSCEALGLEPIQIFGWNITYRNPYVEHPFQLVKVWEGGLASHGGAIGLILAALLLDRKHFHKGIPWFFDRLVIGVAITATLIRLGNLFNSEIYGGPTDLPWGFIFVRDGQTVPCHPTQIYEMIYCIVAGVVSALMYYKTDAARRPGLIFGVWLEIVFFTRFMLEFIKFNQEAFEANFFLNMGQLLSLPFIAWGIYLIVMAYKRPMLPELTPEPIRQATAKTKKK